ncbi:MAG TPA: hypothetical protein VFX05_07290, partial [Casimicrobiaceae bacterium]|nr:hypothetical protein [Casimicrobiaceae bacterium]
MRRAAALLAVLALAAPAGAAAAVSYGGSVGVAYDSNAGNAGDRHDVRDATFVFTSAGASREWRLGKYTGVQLQGALFAEQATGLEDLSNAGLGVRARLLHKPGKGFYTPVLAAWLGAGLREYGSAIRDGADYRAGISATEPLTTAVQVRIEAQRAHREAAGRAFDLG